MDRELFFNLREVNAVTSNCAYEYNFKRPHGSLGQRPAAPAYGLRSISRWYCSHQQLKNKPTPQDSHCNLSSRRARTTLAWLEFIRTCDFEESGNHLGVKLPESSGPGIVWSNRHNSHADPKFENGGPLRLFPMAGVGQHRLADQR